jgi:hypothetical protein
MGEPALGDHPRILGIYAAVRRPRPPTAMSTRQAGAALLGRNERFDIDDIVTHHPRLEARGAVIVVHTSMTERPSPTEYPGAFVCH